jgi:asparagine synthase (glutamine-hydrolysing)
MAHPSSVPLNFVSRLAAEHVKVVLTGEGSDESLAGYGRYRTTLWNLAMGRTWERWGGGRLRGPTRWIIDALPRGWRTKQRLARTSLYLPADLTSLYFDNFAVFSRSRQSTLLSKAVRERIGNLDPYTALQRYVDVYPRASLLNQLLYADTKTYLHELLMKQDQMSMAASIESRVPFLDHPLMEFAGRLPERMKLRRGTTKYVLREAMKGFLPEVILSRSKMGFPVPVGSWFRDQYRVITHEYVLGERARARGLFENEAVRSLVEEHERGAENHWERLWSLVNLEVWQRLFLDGETVADATADMSRVLGRRGVELPAGFLQGTANVLAPSRK